MKNVTAISPRSKRMESHELSPYLLLFKERMTSAGFTTLTIMSYSDAICHFGTWLKINSIHPFEMTFDTLERFSTHRCKCSGYDRSTLLSKKYLSRVKRFLDYLVEIKVVVDMTKPGACQPDLWDRQAFSDWLLNERGLAQITVNNYVSALSKLLPQLGYDAAGYTAGSIRCVVCEFAGRNKPATAKDFTTSVRSYLKYLATSVASQLTVIQCPKLLIIQNLTYNSRFPH